MDEIQNALVDSYQGDTSQEMSANYDTQLTQSQEVYQENPEQGQGQQQSEQFWEPDDENVINDYFKLPQFQNEQEELAVLRERFNHVSELFTNNPDIINDWASEQIQELVQKQNEEIESYAEMYKALQTDPRSFFIQYIPEVLAEYGISPVLSNEQILEQVEKDLAKDFGDNYKQYWNTNDLINPNSLTSQIWLKQQQLINQYNETNARNQELVKNWNTMVSNKEIQPLQPQEYQQKIQESYNNIFAPAGMEQAEYQQFIKEAENYQMNIEDVHRMVHFDDYIQEAYEQGVAAGRQTSYNNTLKAGAKEVVGNGFYGNVPKQPREQNVVNDDWVRVFTNGGIPNY